jgi:hypothetical protein
MIVKSADGLCIAARELQSPAEESERKILRALKLGVKLTPKRRRRYSVIGLHLDCMFEQAVSRQAQSIEFQALEIILAMDCTRNKESRSPRDFRDSGKL